MNALLIPSATLIPAEMRSQMGNIPVCLFPLQNMTMLERICNQYLDTVDRIYVVVLQGKEQVRDFVALKALNIRIVELDKLLDLGYTVRRGLETILAENKDIEQVYINFGDTLVTNLPDRTRRDIIYSAQEALSGEWTFFEHEKGVITSITDKSHVIPEAETFGNAFPGVFQIAHPAEWEEEMKTAQEVSENKMDPFYQALKSYSEKHPFTVFPAEDWFDVGHREKYAQARTAVAARSFNSIVIDRDRGLLTKRSENRDKLINEIKWYLKLPDQLQYLAPRIYRYSLDWNSPYVTMEYYGYTTLHEMLVYGDLKDAQWRKIFRKLRFVLEDMRRYEVNDPGSTFTLAMEDVYISKTVSRLEKLREAEGFKAFFENGIQVNGKQFPSLDECIKRLPTLVERKLIRSPRNFCVIHGDLCFSNILVESDLGFFRVIDPRGSFGDYDIYGDPRYEIAKLMHSLDGQYDLIIEDMFSVQVSGSTMTLDIPNKSKNVYTVFRDVFSDILEDERELKLVESLLFLSMLPLHSDARNRQYAMLATGLRLLDEAVGSELYGNE